MTSSRYEAAMNEVDIKGFNVSMDNFVIKSFITRDQAISMKYKDTCIYLNPLEE